MSAPPAPHETASARPLLRLGHWIALFWLASAAILLDMRSEALADLDFGDTDDAMRLVQTRDLLAGQGWLDRTQYRLDPPAGVEMHWSRLPDAALGGLILIARPLLGERGAERFAVAAWPLLLLLAWFALLADFGRRVAGPSGGLAALFLGLLAVPATGQFLPARIDHHGLQVVLALALVSLLARAPERPGAGAAGGLVAALMLAIGLETMPYLVAAEIALGVMWARDPCRLGPAVRLHGLVLALATAAMLGLSVPAASWTATACDSLSAPHVVAAMLAGLIWMTASMSGPELGTPVRRFAVLALYGGAAAALLVLLFPDCRGGPYEMIDARMRDIWLSHVREAQSLPALLGKSPDLAVAFLGFPLIGVAALATVLRRDGTRPEWLLSGLCLVAAVLVSSWQVRGAYFAAGFAVLPTARLLVDLLGRAAALPGTIGRVLASAAVLALLNGLPFALLGQWMAPERAGASAAGDSCTSPEALAALGALPAATVLAGIDHGPDILVHTRHGVLAAPYHRNRDGLHAAFDIWTAPPEDAARLLRQRGVGLVAFCADAADIALLARRAPEGLAARLGANVEPAGLQRLAPEFHGGMQLFGVVREASRTLTGVDSRATLPR